MNFSFTDEQEAVRDLATRILGDQVTLDRLKELEGGPDRFDRNLWAELARANLLGIAVPEAHGGSGFGLLEACLVLEQVGRTVAPVPALATLAFGALPLARLGSAAQCRRLLPGVAAGDVVLTAAVLEPGGDDPVAPTTKATADGAAWRVDGVKTCVPAASLAAAVLVAAQCDDGPAVLLVDPRGPGVTLEAQRTTSGDPESRMVLDGAPGDRLPGPAALASLLDHAVTGVCAVQTGVAGEALRLTAEYTSSRHQFGRPIASFQAVAQRAADAFVDVEAVRLATWEAAWRVDAGLPASDEVAVAKFWAAEGGQRVVAAAQHLHGGIGVDVDYPLHRYVRWGKRLELMLGGAHTHLARLGKAMARA